MKRFFLALCFVGMTSSLLLIDLVEARGPGRGGGGGVRGGGAGFGGGGFHGGGAAPAVGGIQRGGGVSGGGFRPAPAARPSHSAPQSRPQAPAINRPSSGPAAGGAAVNRPNVVHTPNTRVPGAGASNLQVGSRPQIQPGGQITRPDLTPGSRPQLGPATAQRPSLPSSGGTGQNTLPGVRPGQAGSGTATLPGLGSSQSAGGAGMRLPFGDHPGAGGGTRLPSDARPGVAGQAGGNLQGRQPGQASTAERLPGFRSGQEAASQRYVAGNAASIPDRHQDLAARFDDLQTHGTSGEWHQQQWTGPQGGEMNHVGFWGPNGYWGHTGVSGPNGGHWGHSTGITSEGAWGRTTGIGPGGAVWGHGAGVGPNGAFGYAGYSGPAGHWSRNWGGWYNGYAPAWGHGRWDYLWDTYPAAMAFGATMWGLNAVACTLGVSSYDNPYSDGPVYADDQQVTSYSEPIVGDPVYETEAVAAAEQSADGATDGAASGTASSSSDPLTDLFNQARQAFYDEQFEQALQLTSQALIKAPRDAAINEFRSLCLFARGQYREAAAAIHAILAAGPGWDWTTMTSLYSHQDTYTNQLRKLEAAVKANSQSADARFLLAYHYLTAEHTDEAVALWKQIVQLEPNDKLSAELVKIYSPASEDSARSGEAPPQAPSPNVEKPAYPMEKLYGDWTARADGGEFSLHLGENDEFTWKFTHDGQPQSVAGAYIVRGDNLVMQPDTGGTMLSTIVLENERRLVFTPIGDAQKLVFQK